MNKQDCIEEKTWEEFRDAGLWWWFNRSLHLFGWVLVREENEDGSIARVYPGRTIFRGFDTSIEDKGFKRVTQYLKDNMEELYKEVFEDENDNNSENIK